MLELLGFEKVGSEGKGELGITGSSFMCSDEESTLCSRDDVTGKKESVGVVVEAKGY